MAAHIIGETPEEEKRIIGLERPFRDRVQRLEVYIRKEFKMKYRLALDHLKEI